MLYSIILYFDNIIEFPTKKLLLYLVTSLRYFCHRSG